jgi:hypothetical protein
LMRIQRDVHLSTALAQRDTELGPCNRNLRSPLSPAEAGPRLCPIAGASRVAWIPGTAREDGRSPLCAGMSG